MSLVTAGRAHIRPSRRTYLALGWYALEFAGPPVVIGIDPPISIHPIGSRVWGVFGTRFFFARRNSSSTTTPAADSACSPQIWRSGYGHGGLTFSSESKARRFPPPRDDLWRCQCWVFNGGS